jgi:hypothetical protein
MTSEDIVNTVIAKLGGNRVEFIDITSEDYLEEVTFVHAGYTYIAQYTDKLSVYRELSEQGPATIDSYSVWMEGVLTGKIRDESGALTKARLYG